MNYRYLSLFLLLASSSLMANDVSEKKTEEYLNVLKSSHSLQKIEEFVKKMPKGADLHNHQAGASMAENMIQYGKNDALCIDALTYASKKDANCEAPYKLSELNSYPLIYNAVIDAWSMRNFKPGANESGRNHFFHAGSKYGAVYRKHQDDFLLEVVKRASEQNVLYLELMHSSASNSAYFKALANSFTWDENNFEDMANQLLAQQDMQTLIKSISLKVTANEQTLQQGLKCQTVLRDPACSVKVRYMLQGYRTAPKPQVFVQLLAYFIAAHQDQRLAGINMVQAEDNAVALQDYGIQMKMIGWLRSKYPDVNVTLHAGELNPQLVPADDLRFHIRDAVEIAKVDRIGHGVDISHEDNYQDLLQEMKEKHVMVEINLTSNEAILDIKGANHPLPLYLQAGVPVALSTDDEGVLRTNLSMEYNRAVNSYDLDYKTLKGMVRNSMEYSFLKGKSLWLDHDYNTWNEVCLQDTPTLRQTPSKACATFLKNNEKAKLQWLLEARLNKFEALFAK